MATESAICPCPAASGLGVHQRPRGEADYEKVVAGSAIAGPAAVRIRNHEMTQRELDWPKSNFYKSEMELGPCTRLPEEGPCECDLFRPAATS